MPDAVMKTYRLELTSVACYLLGLALMVGAILWLNHGTLTYSLDDPYIHLALADNLAQGHHGLNPDEPAAPSSSILWPVLLVPFAGLEHFEVVPLALTTLAMAATVLLIARGFRRRLAAELPPSALAVVLFLLALFCNFFGMPLNGMEHSLQLLLTAAVALGLIDLVEDHRASPLFLAALTLAPLVRFENTSLLIMGATVLIARRHVGKALSVLALVAVAFGAHAYFLQSLGLSWLPSSVLIKSEIASAGSLGTALFEIGENLLEGFGKDRNWAILLALGLLVHRLRERPDEPTAPSHRLYLVFLSGVVGAHFLFGRYDWLGRYEIYLLLSSALILLFVFREPLRGLIDQRRRLALAALVLAVLVASKTQIAATLGTPLAANNVYATNLQLRRFAVDFWRDSIAVNDAGLASFRNPYYVLDLWGLSSEEARRARRADEGNAWADKVARAHGVDLLIVFEDWFTERGPLPASWEKVGELGLKSGHTHSGGRKALLLLDPSRREEVLAAIEAFRPTLPQPASGR